jgi:adenylosuccinate synthase
MAVLAIVGGQWGDEGKGKIVDLLGDQCRMVARYNGGDNAGHTVVNQYGKFKMHLIPSGIFSARTTCIVGNGVVVNPKALLEELAGLRSAKIELAQLFISDRAHVIMPYHLTIDRLEEESRGKSSIGTTGKGIGPAYVDKYGRLGIRMGDLVDEQLFRQKLAFVLEQKNRVLTRLYGAEPLDFNRIMDEYLGYADQLAGHVADTTEMIQKAVAAGENVLLEGAQGTMLDIDFGTYPYVTSSNAVVAGGYVGAGLAPNQPVRALGIFKAYATRVGGGPLPTELHDETGIAIREAGHEYGTTTGRPRRCGWFDAVTAKYSVRLNGLASIALTKLDVLDQLASVRICVGYRRGGVVLQTVPASTEALEQCEPLYEELPGWQQSTAAAKDYSDLPERARQYVARLESLVQCPIDIISVGPDRQQTITRRPAFALGQD